MGPFDEPSPPAGDPVARLAWAEARFAEGDVALARRTLRQLAGEPAAPEILADAHSNLAVIAATLGDAPEARACALAALALQADRLEALEVLGRLADAAGDPTQAAHWFGRACALTPSDAPLLRALAAAEHRRARWEAAIGALHAAAAIESLPDEDRVRLAQLESPGPAAQAPGFSRPRGDLLVCCDWFFPSLGGTERLAEGVGVALQRLGWNVEIACRAMPERGATVHRGLTIRELAEPHDAALATLVGDRVYDAVLAFSDPYAWPVPAVLRLPDGAPRRVVVPCINPGNERGLRAHPHNLHAWGSLLPRANVVVHSSRGGLDARLNCDLGIAGVFVPNATEHPPAAPAGARAAFGVAEHERLLVCVANLYPDKGHVELLERLARHDGDWRLLLIGAAPDAVHARRVERLVEADPRVTLAGRRSPEEVAAALGAADVVLLPSRLEATPLCLLEAMSHGVPWIATPQSGAAIEWAGGLVLSVEDLPAGVDRLLDDPDAGRRLGEAGRRHWEACFCWDVVARRYDALLRGARALPDLPPPADAQATTDALRAEVYDGLAAGADPRARRAA